MNLKHGALRALPADLAVQTGPDRYRPKPELTELLKAITLAFERQREEFRQAGLPTSGIPIAVTFPQRGWQTGYCRQCGCATLTRGEWTRGWFRSGYSPPPRFCSNACESVYSRDYMDDCRMIHPRGQDPHRRV